MKKIIPVLILAIFIVPSLALASWWNPFSWFKKAPVLSPVVETQKEPVKSSEIEELKKQIEELKNQVVPVKTPVIKEVNKVAPIQVIPVVAPVVVKDFCPNLDGVQAVFPSGYVLDRASGKCLSNTDNDAIDKIKSELEAVRQQNKALDEKTELLREINLKIANLNSKYAKDSAEIKLNRNGGMAGAMNSFLDNLESTYTDNYNALMAEFQQVKYSN